MKVAFIHPDLGIGGAERLVIDAAVEFMAAGNEVVMYTGYHDVARCFEETLVEDGTRAHWIKVHGAWLPRSIGGYFHALMANVRCLYCTLWLLMNDADVDVVVLDQVSSPIALVRMLTNTATIFYCHFPDMLLATRVSLFRTLYRAPVNFIEQLTTGMAHKVVVNSKFTEDAFYKTFTHLYQKGVHPRVVYPAVELDGNENNARMNDRHSLASTSSDSQITFLSINRFERKKNLQLALWAYARYVEGLKGTGIGNQSDRDQSHSDDGKKTKLILAGGYDARLTENVTYLSDLKREAMRLNIQDFVEFRPSVSSDEKNQLINACICVLYTPTNEHFGIVPVEAMAASKPVIACNSGGPKESIVDGVTGILCEPDSEQWAQAMAHVSRDAGGVSRRMGQLAREHVGWKFSRRAFGRKMMSVADAAILAAEEERRKTSNAIVTSSSLSLFVVFVLINAKIYGVMLGAISRYT